MSNESVPTTNYTIDWQPNPEGLNQILALVRDSQNPNPQVQQRVHQQFQQLSSVPDLSNYLVFVLTKLKNETEYARAVAGITLKNMIRENYNGIPDQVKNYIRQEVLNCIGDPMNQVRKTVGSIITTLLTKGGLSSWPNLLPALLQLLDSTDLNTVEGAFSALSLISEDFANRLDKAETSGPLNLLIPKFLQFFKSPHEIFRRYAITCVNQFIPEMPNALAVNMNNFLQGIFFLANDPSPEVRKKVCEAFVMITEVRVEYLTPYIKDVITYMISATQDKNDELALEACEFWSVISETKLCKPSVAEFLPTLIPVLLDRMCYSDDDPMLTIALEEESTPDQAKDIKPFFHKSHSHKSGGNQVNTSTDSNNTSQNDTSTDLSDGEDDDDEDDDDFEEELREWNIRKCAAAGIDILSIVFRDDLLPFVIQTVQAKLNDKDNWKNRESAILTLGAVAEGCYNGMKVHLAQLIPFLTALITDPHPLIRSITCWTISRYSRWILRQKETDKYFKPVLLQFLNRMLDTNKKVQEAACSAFATLEEEAKYDLIPYLTPVLQCLMTAFGRYQAKNLLILYDAIGTLADSVGGELNKPDLIAILMPPLIVRWNALPDDNPALLPLLECLTSIATALGDGFANFVPPVYQRCLRIVENTIIQEAMAIQNPQQNDQPDKEFMVCALDLISGIIDGLRQNSEGLIANSNLTSLLFQCMKDTRADVRQSAFALVGDMAKHCFNCLKSALENFIPVLVKNLYPDYVGVCNNAAWSLGEISLKIGAEMRPFVSIIIERLIPMMNKRSLNENLLENTAITIGRLGLVCTDLVAPRLEEYIQSWCMTLREMVDDSEKDSAFRGLCALIKANPNAVVKHFIFVCDAISSWERPKQDLKEMFYAILHGFKNSVGPELWAQYYNNFPEHLRKNLQQSYNL